MSLCLLAHHPSTADVAPCTEPEVAIWDVIPWSEKSKTTLGHNRSSRTDGLRESKSTNTAGLGVFLGWGGMFAFVHVVQIGRRWWDES